VHRSLGSVYESQDDLSRATREFRTAILLNANDAEAHYELGKIDVESGDAASAIRELEAAAKLTPERPAVHRELAAAYRLASRNDDAAKQVQIYDSLTTPAASTEKPVPAADGKSAAK
jgi:Flp pilus assembly protein TadD